YQHYVFALEAGHLSAAHFAQESYFVTFLHFYLFFVFIYLFVSIYQSVCFNLFHQVKTSVPPGETDIFTWWNLFLPSKKENTLCKDTKVIAKYRCF
uniref:hypothetical protein n=1 Tax=Prevotella sp. TaxID=59823 RepID=UPI00402A38F8